MKGQHPLHFVVLMRTFSRTGDYRCRLTSTLTMGDYEGKVCPSGPQAQQSKSEREVVIVWH